MSPERCHWCLEEIVDPAEHVEVEVPEDGRVPATVLVASHRGCQEIVEDPATWASAWAGGR